MFLEGLDALDQKIVSLLIENARMSYSDIAQRVGISRVAVKMRVQALEKRGVIEGYTTIIDPQRSAAPFPAILRSRRPRSRLPK